MLQSMDSYFVNFSCDDVVYRLKNNELELYIGNGNWEQKPGLYMDYRTGKVSLVSADGEQIKVAMEARDKMIAKEEQ